MIPESSSSQTGQGSSDPQRQSQTQVPQQFQSGSSTQNYPQQPGYTSSYAQPSYTPQTIYGQPAYTAPNYPSSNYAAPNYNTSKFATPNYNYPPGGTSPPGSTAPTYQHANPSYQSSTFSQGQSMDVNEYKKKRDREQKIEGCYWCLFFTGLIAGFVLFIPSVVLVPIGVNLRHEVELLSPETDFQFLGKVCNITEVQHRSEQTTRTEDSRTIYTCYDIYQYFFVAPNSTEIHQTGEDVIFRGDSPCSNLPQRPGRFVVGDVQECWKPIVVPPSRIYYCGGPTCYKLSSPSIDIDNAATTATVLIAVGSPMLVIGVLFLCCCTTVRFMHMKRRRLNDARRF